jgi:hypothetical protein
MSPRIRISAAALLAITAFSCTTIEVPVHSGAPPRDSKNSFSHAEFDGVLRRFVNKSGLVDYGGLRLDHAQLDKYLGQIAQTSPENDKSLFPDKWHRMAYWINAYNACVLKQIIDNNITDSVGGSIPSEFKFFKSTRFFVGGAAMSLNAIEENAGGLADARVYFVINYGALGSPRLRAEAMSGESLDKVLEEAAREFCNDPKQISINNKTDDEPLGSVTFSKVFDWHEREFTEYARGRGVAGATLRDAVNLWRDKGARVPLNGTNIINNFNWALNKQDVAPGAK